MDLETRRHNTLLFNLSLLHYYFSQHCYLYIQNFFSLSGSAGKKPYILQPTFIISAPVFRLRFTFPWNDASWSFFWNEPTTSSPSVGSK